MVYIANPAARRRTERDKPCLQRIQIKIHALLNRVVQRAALLSIAECSVASVSRELWCMIECEVNVWCVIGIGTRRMATATDQLALSQSLEIGFRKARFGFSYKPSLLVVADIVSECQP